MNAARGNPRGTSTYPDVPMSVDPAGASVSVDDLLRGCGLPSRSDMPLPSISYSAPSAPAPVAAAPPRAPLRPRFYTTATPSVFRWYANTGHQSPHKRDVDVYDFRLNHPNAAPPAVWPNGTDIPFGALFHGALRSGVAPVRYSDAAYSDATQPNRRAPRTSDRGVGLSRWDPPPPPCGSCGAVGGPDHRCAVPDAATAPLTSDVGFMVRSPNGTYLCGCGYAVRYSDRCYNRCGSCGAQLYDAGPPRYHPLDAAERGRVMAYIKSWRASAGIVDQPAQLTGRKFTPGERAYAAARAYARSPSANADRLVAPMRAAVWLAAPEFHPRALDHVLDSFTPRDRAAALRDPQRIFDAISIWARRNQKHRKLVRGAPVDVAPRDFPHWRAPASGLSAAAATSRVGAPRDRDERSDLAPKAHARRTRDIDMLTDLHKRVKAGAITTIFNEGCVLDVVWPSTSCCPEITEGLPVCTRCLEIAHRALVANAPPGSMLRPSRVRFSSDALARTSFKGHADVLFRAATCTAHGVGDAERFPTTRDALAVYPDLYPVMDIGEDYGAVVIEDRVFSLERPRILVFRPAPMWDLTAECVEPNPGPSCTIGQPSLLPASTLRIVIDPLYACAGPGFRLAVACANFSGRAFRALWRRVWGWLMRWSQRLSSWPGWDAVLDAPLPPSTGPYLDAVGALAWRGHVALHDLERRVDAARAFATIATPDRSKSTAAAVLPLAAAVVAVSATAYIAIPRIRAWAAFFTARPVNQSDAATSLRDSLAQDPTVRDTTFHAFIARAIHSTWRAEVCGLSDASAVWWRALLGATTVFVHVAPPAAFCEDISLPSHRFQLFRDGASVFARGSMARDALEYSEVVGPLPCDAPVHGGEFSYGVFTRSMSVISIPIPEYDGPDAGALPSIARVSLLCFGPWRLSLSRAVAPFTRPVAVKSVADVRFITTPSETILAMSSDLVNTARVPNAQLQTALFKYHTSSTQARLSVVSCCLSAYGEIATGAAMALAAAGHMHDACYTPLPSALGLNVGVEYTNTGHFEGGVGRPAANVVLHQPLVTSPLCYPYGGAASLMASIASRNLNYDNDVVPRAETIFLMRVFARLVVGDTQLHAMGLDDVRAYLLPHQDRELFELRDIYDMAPTARSVFIKSEAFSPLKTPRIIIPFTGPLNYELRRWLIPLTLHVRQHPWFSPGQSCKEIQDRVATLIAIARRREGRHRNAIYMADASKFDAHTGIFARVLTREILQAAFPNDPGWRAHIDGDVAGLTRARGVRPGVVADLGNGTMSGCFKTTIINTLTMAFLAFEALFQSAACDGETFAAQQATGAPPASSSNGEAFDSVFSVVRGAELQMPPVEAKRVLSAAAIAWGNMQLTVSAAGDDILMLPGSVTLSEVGPLNGFPITSELAILGDSSSDALVFLGRLYVGFDGSCIADPARWFPRIHTVGLPPNHRPGDVALAIRARGAGWAVNDPDTPIIRGFVAGTIGKRKVALDPRFYDSWTYDRLVNGGPYFCSLGYGELLPFVACRLGLSPGVVDAIDQHYAAGVHVGMEMPFAPGKLSLSALPPRAGLIINGMPIGCASSAPTYQRSAAARAKRARALREYAATAASRGGSVPDVATALAHSAADVTGLLGQLDESPDAPPAACDTCSPGCRGSATTPHDGVCPLALPCPTCHSTYHGLPWPPGEDRCPRCTMCGERGHTNARCAVAAERALVRNEAAEPHEPRSKRLKGRHK